MPASGDSPRRRSKKGLVWGIVAGVVLLFIIIGNLGGGGDSETPVADVEPSAPAAGAPAQPEPVAPAPEPAVAVIGSPVRDGKFEFTVTSVERVGPTIGEGFTEETAQGEYLVVRLNVTNIGDEPQMLSTGGQVLYNDKGQKYEPSSDALFSLEGASDFFLEDINPGNTIVGAPLLFDVPPGTVLDRIELHDSLFSGGVDVSIAGS
ncbi:DUF4352 domain-containing protein [Cellulomonas fimi]|uniref:DUF4352 domain-containing protein n=1 Tax=Cellulomonas fimi TaxID=1708 RepID=A0A7Y0LY79_CELFI|nr:DUF4352 domain-containing protein [Cellulomonas fimi]NMR20059.1 DUF4352 domain-containing protein [Cellulomonas fimi]